MLGSQSLSYALSFGHNREPHFRLFQNVLAVDQITNQRHVSLLLIMCSTPSIILVSNKGNQSILSLSVLNLSIWSKYMEANNVQVTQQPLPQLTKEMFGPLCLMPFTTYLQLITASCLFNLLPHHQSLLLITLWRTFQSCVSMSGKFEAQKDHLIVITMPNEKM